MVPSTPFFRRQVWSTKYQLLVSVPVCEWCQGKRKVYIGIEDTAREQVFQSFRPSKLGPLAYIEIMRVVPFMLLTRALYFLVETVHSLNCSGSWSTKSSIIEYMR